MKDVLTTNTSQKIPMLDVNQLQYSDKYQDDVYEYRHIILPKDFAKYVPRNHLMTETEWRNLGIQQSPGWIHYLIHSPEPHILMFRRPLPADAQRDTNGVSAIVSTVEDVENIEDSTEEAMMEMEDEDNSMVNDSNNSSNLVDIVD